MSDKVKRDIGYSPEFAQEIRQSAGFLALVLYWQLFDAYSVERVLTEDEHCAFYFGAGVSVYESREMCERVERALEPYVNVFLVLPSPDTERSIEILRRRDLNPPPGFDFVTHFLRHPGYYQLAKFMVFTDGKTPEETCAEILSLANPA